MKATKLQYDYWLREDGLLYKPSIDESKHLLKMAGMTPAVNKRVFDENKDKIEWLGFKTKSGKKFMISKSNFDFFKSEINYTEPQYYIPREFREHWIIEAQV